MIKEPIPSWIMSRAIENLTYGTVVDLLLYRGKGPFEPQLAKLVGALGQIATSDVVEEFTKEGTQACCQS